MKLQSVELSLPGTAAAAEFLENTWRLIPCGKHRDAHYFRGCGTDPYLLSITEATTPAVQSISFAVAADELDALLTRIRHTGASASQVGEFDLPGAGQGVFVRGPERQTYRLVVNAEASAAASSSIDVPVQITHTVINTLDLNACEAFATEVLGLRISDRTRAMTFVRCNRKHHCIAYAPAAQASLNHIAFEMRDIDGVMRGIGRMRDAGHPPVWGPGRHGPGDNVFAYFLAPFGGVIEYTAEVSEVDDDYRVGTPEDWQWPPGRIDQWGVSTKEVARIQAAEKYFCFGP